MDEHAVAAVVVAWDSGPALLGCVDALRAQQPPLAEVLLVDNASRDGYPQRVATGDWPELRVIANATNVGYTAALNQALALTSAPFLLVVNPDARPAPDYAERLRAALDGDAQGGMAGGTLLRPGGSPRIDSAGLTLDWLARARDRQRGAVPAGADRRPEPVFALCGAAVLYRRAMLVDVMLDGEAFDSALNAYYDDVDLAWRAQRCGWRCWYVPQALAWHERGAADRLRHSSGTATARRLATRNRLLVLAMHEPRLRLLLRAPLLTAYELARAGYAAWREPAVLGAYVDFLRALPRALRRRRLLAPRSP